MSFTLELKTTMKVIEENTEIIKDFVYNMLFFKYVVLRKYNNTSYPYYNQKLF